MEIKEHLATAKALYEQAKGIFEQETVTAEDAQKAGRMVEDAKAHQQSALQLKELTDGMASITEDAVADFDKKTADRRGAPKFTGLGQYLVQVALAGNRDYRGTLHPALKRWHDPEEPGGYSIKDWRDVEPGSSWVEAGQTKEQKATMVENIGSRGGFLVPTEQMTSLLSVGPEANSIRNRATIIPMSRRTIRIPSIDQTGTTAGQPHWFGGMLAKWTEEQAAKEQTDPTFRQVELVAHKLVVYTRSSDELLEDEAAGLVAFLQGPMGFNGAINWEEEYTFLQGTGVGQPQGVLGAGCTINIARQRDGSFDFADFTNMLEAFLMTGGRGVWMISQSCMSEVCQMSGPAGNASYVWAANARDGIPGTILGMPVIWTEKLPARNTAGDILLANWPYYLVGDRKRTTIESSNQERFQYDETSWRAVHRVDGRPWLSAPLTLQDGAAEMSPFVILGEKSS